MKRADLEHVLRASKDITGETEFIVLGSQSLLGPYPDAPAELCVSMEVDLYPKNRPELAMLIEALIESADSLELREKLEEALKTCRNK
jgi:hypothetical protein